MRTHMAPWGKSSLRRRELESVCEGNTLMGFSLESMAALATTQGAGILEHPGQPDDPEVATIWAQPILRLLADLPGMRIVRVCQGLHGAASVKPTDLLTLNLPMLEHCLRQWRVTMHSPSTASIGIDETGHFRTAPLKEYPPSLCGSMAQALVQAIASYPLDADVQTPADFLAICEQMTVSHFGSHIGPDFAGR